MVLIAGPSSSGKTTSCKRLSIQLLCNGIRPVPVSLDDYFVDRELTPKDENGDYDFESLHALNLPLLNKQLMQLFNGEEVELPKYDFIKGRSVPSGQKMRMRPGDVLVIEGIHALNPELTSQIPEEYKYRVYASALTTIHPHHRQPLAAPHHTRLQAARMHSARHHTPLAERAPGREQMDIPLPGECRRNVQHSHDIRTGSHKDPSRTAARTGARELRRVCRGLPSAQVPQLFPPHRPRRSAPNLTVARVPRRQLVLVLKAPRPAPPLVGRGKLFSQTPTLQPIEAHLSSILVLYVPTLRNVCHASLDYL